MIMLLWFCMMMSLHAANTTFYVTNMPKDVTLAGANKGNAQVVEPHNIGALVGSGKYFGTNPLIIDAGYFSKQFTTDGLSKAFKENPWLTMVVMQDGSIGRMAGTKVQSSQTLALSSGGIPMVFTTIGTKDATSLKQRVYGNGGNYNAKFVVAFCGEGSSTAKKLLGQVNANGPVVDVMVCSQGGEVKVEQSNQAVFILLPSPSPAMVRIDVEQTGTGNTRKALILDHGFLQRQKK